MGFCLEADRVLLWSRPGKEPILVPPPLPPQPIFYLPKKKPKWPRLIVQGALANFQTRWEIIMVQTWSVEPYDKVAFF